MGDMKPGDTGGGVGLGNWESDALEANYRRVKAERDELTQRLAVADTARARAVETRENANAATLRAEVERDELKAENERLLRVVDEAIRERDLAYARDEAVKNTLTNVGAPTHDEADRELTANGMLVDWLAGRRNPRWIGGEGAVIDELRGQVATLLEAIGRLYEYRKAGGKDISAGGLFQLLVGRADAIIERTGHTGGQGDG